MIYVTARELQEHDAILESLLPTRVFCGVYGEDQVVSVVIGPVPDSWSPQPVAYPSQKSP